MHYRQQNQLYLSATTQPQSHNHEPSLLNCASHTSKNKEKRAYDSLFSARSLPFFNHVQYDLMQSTLLRSQDSYPNELINSETPTY